MTPEDVRSDARNMADLFDNVLDGLKSQVMESYDNYEDTVTELDRVKEEFYEIEDERDNLLEKVEELKTDLEIALDENKTLEQERDELLEKVEELKADLEDAN